MTARLLLDVVLACKVRRRYVAVGKAVVVEVLSSDALGGEKWVAESGTSREAQLEQGLLALAERLESAERKATAATRCGNVFEGDGMPCMLDPGHAGSHVDSEGCDW